LIVMRQRPLSPLVTFRDHLVPASAGGGAGGAETVAVTVLVALWPSAVSIRTVKVCVPGLEERRHEPAAVVTVVVWRVVLEPRVLAVDLKEHLGHRRRRGDGGVTSQCTRTGRVVSPSRLDLTVNGSEVLSASADETTVTQASAMTANRRALMGMEIPFEQR
jgi:hypothetical protein